MRFVGGKGRTRKLRTYLALIPLIAICLISFSKTVMAGAPTPAAPIVDPGTPHDFGSVNQGATSAVLTVKIGNSGDSFYRLDATTPYALTTGTNFEVQSSTCTANLKINGNTTEECTIDVVFKPTSAGALSDTLTINTDTATDPTVSLTGTGVAVPIISLDKTSLDFGFQRVGVASDPQTVTLTNDGDADLVIDVNGVVITDDAEGNYDLATDNCSGETLAPGADCTFEVTFTPVDYETNPKTAKVVVTADTLTGEVTLTGNGAYPEASITPSNDPFTFADLNVGDTPLTQVFTLKNTGDLPLEITSIDDTNIGGDFSMVNDDCPISPSTLAPDGTCTVTVTFAPTSFGEKTGYITITDDAEVTTQTINLKGTGVSPNVVFDPLAGLDFGNQNIATTSAVEFIKVTNNGNSLLSFDKIELTGDAAMEFVIDATNSSEGTNCTTLSTLDVDGECYVYLTFTPTVVDERLAKLDIVDSTFGSTPLTWSADLKGFGTDPAVTLDPVALLFGDQAQGFPSSVKQVKLTNSGIGRLAIASIAIDPADGVFSQINNCEPSVAQGADCFIDVTFTPTALGEATADLVITDDASSGTQTVPLSGTGVAPVPVVELDPEAVSFSPQTVETTSDEKIVTLSNTGKALLTITRITATGEFSIIENCPDSLSYDEACTMKVTFSPKSVGEKTGDITIVTTETGSHTVALSGTGTAEPVSVNLSMTKDAEPNPTECKKDVTYTLVVSSKGTAAANNVVVTDTLPKGLTFVSLATTVGECTQDDENASCELGTLAVGQSATITVVATPTAAGKITNEASVTADEVTTAVTATVDLTVADVNCEKEEGGGCSMLPQAGQGMASVLSVIAGLGALIAIRRRK